MPLAPHVATREELAASSAFTTEHIPAAPAPAPARRLRPVAPLNDVPPIASPPAAVVIGADRRPTAPVWRVGAMVGGGFFLVIGLLGWVASRRRPAAERAAAPARPAAEPFEVRRISVAFDWTERQKLQAELEALAGKLDMSTEQGMLRAAKATRDLLLGAIDAARYATFARFHLGSSGAESQFQRLAIGLRSRFTEETVDNARRAIARTRVARPDEGEGLVLISLVVGTAHHLPEVPKALGRADVARVLEESVPAAGADLVAFEVIWSPSEENDRMSSAELEVLYPELARLDDDRAIGRVACDYCRAPYPAELGKCPSCGAPRPS